jgi:hypothetical protein
MKSTTFLKSLEAVTAKWTKQRKQENRGRAQSRRVALTRCSGPSIKYAAATMMKEAYLKASDNGKLPASTRQIYYAARKQIMEMTGKSALDSQYFTQTVLPEYIAHPFHRTETATWDITYDARGHFAEPHTEVITPLGTLDVRGYLADVREHAVEPLDVGQFFAAGLMRFPTCGPEHRFNAILFIEKEGFMPLFEATKLAERYDIAIMSTKGMPVVACRCLADELCGKHGIPLLVLHDFDKAGFSIAGTLAGVDHYDKNFNQRTTRYKYRHAFEVIDLGLRLSDVNEYNLESEPVHYKSNPSNNLDENGVTQEEIAFLCDSPNSYRPTGRRVELNAFTSADFIRWIEAKLQANGITKVIPDADTLEAAYRRAVQIEVVREQLGAIVEEAVKQAQQAKLPKNLDRIVRKGFKADPAQSWDQVIGAVAAANCRKQATGKTTFQQAKSAAPAGENLTKPSRAPGKRSGGKPRKTSSASVDFGMSEGSAEICRTLASMPEGLLDEYIAQVSKEEDGEVTTEGYLRFCKKRLARSGDSACSKDRAE